LRSIAPVFALSAVLVLSSTSSYAQESTAAAPQAAMLSSAPAMSARSEYRVLATSKTSTMQKELNEAADGGFKFVGVMGGGTTFGGSEVVSLMERPYGGGEKGRYEYKLLATNKTSTMQKELNEAGDAGFEYKGQTVFDTRFGGDEVVSILERDKTGKRVRYQYLVLATKKTSTMQKELQEAGDQGYSYIGVTVSKTMFGGTEVVTIMSKKVEE
jgi:hypothetical protein